MTHVAINLEKEMELTKRAFINSETIPYPSMKNKNDQKELWNNINNISLTSLNKSCVK